MIYSNTSGLKAIFDNINGSKFLRFLILLVFLFFLLELIFADRVPSAKSAKIKHRYRKIKVLHGILTANLRDTNHHLQSQVKVGIAVSVRS